MISSFSFSSSSSSLFLSPRFLLNLVANFPFSSIISVKAKSFADREIRYTLKAQGQGAAGTFNIGPTTGIVKLAKELDFEDLRQPHIYSLIVTATEDSGGFSTSVEVHSIPSYIQFLFFFFLFFFKCTIVRVFVENSRKHVITNILRRYDWNKLSRIAFVI